MKQVLIIICCLFITLANYAQTELWGMTRFGGQYNVGTIFKTDSAGDNLITKFHFDTINGRSPYGSLLLASDGMLYGMTEWGGVNTVGVLFQYNPITNILTKKFDFDYDIAASGSQPSGSLIQAPNGYIYGMTGAGGAFGVGVLFQYDISSSILTKIIDFSGPNGTFPSASLMNAYDGMLYATTDSGGPNSYGTLFQYDPINNIQTNKMDFNGWSTGSSPKSLC